MKTTSGKVKKINILKGLRKILCNEKNEFYVFFKKISQKKSEFLRGLRVLKKIEIKLKRSAYRNNRI